MNIAKYVSMVTVVVGLFVTSAAAQRGDHLIVSNLKVPKANRLGAGEPYLASLNIRTTGAPVQIYEMCFFWNKEGPFCFKNFEMREGSDGGTQPTISLVTGNPGRYTLFLS